VPSSIVQPSLGMLTGEPTVTLPRAGRTPPGIPSVYLMKMAVHPDLRVFLRHLIIG
jgi:hypothetical protein